MANNFLDLIISHYLRGGRADKTLRGALHESTPPPANVATVTPAGVSPLPQTLGVSFIPLSNAVGTSPVQPASTQAIAWARNITEVLGGIDPDDQQDVVSRYGHIQSSLVEPRSMLPGFFYTFRYEAKTIDHYDRYPLMLALNKTPGGIFGMNFHYLPMKLRFALFESMMPLILPLPVIQLSRIYLTYKQLSRRRLVGTKPTFKQYSYAQFKSRVVFISPLEWAVAMAYPSERFMNTSSAQVWSESRNHLY